MPGSPPPPDSERWTRRGSPGRTPDTGSRNLADQHYWNKAHDEFALTVDAANPVFRFIEQHGGRGPGDVLEIGCFPGRLLPAFGRLGYRLNGVDLNRRTEHELPAWLQSQGYPIGKFEIADFDRLQTARQYDVVASFGFIEHFIDWNTVLLRHAALCKPGGRLLVTTPNFDCAVQRVMHRLFDNDSYRCHVLAAMHPEEWAQLLAAHGFEIEYCGYFGAYGFSLHSQRGLLRRAIQFVGLGLNKLLLRPIFTRLPEGRRNYAGFCGVVARKCR